MTNKLTKEQFKQLYEIITDIYRTPDELTVFIKHALGENRYDFAGGDNLRDISYKIIDWCEAKGRLNELLEGLYAENKQNEDLIHFLGTTDIDSTGLSDIVRERKVNQFGNKSIYIEKNNGDININ
jgi:hypothetical protein